MDHFNWLKWLNNRQIDGKHFVLTEEMEDVTIICNGKRIKSNEKMLRTHSGYFREILDNFSDIHEIRGTFMYTKANFHFLGQPFPPYESMFLVLKESKSCLFLTIPALIKVLV